MSALNGGLTCQTHTLSVPLAWNDPADPRRIEVFARVVTRPGGEDLPYLVFLQGGPGHEAPRPSLKPAEPGWLPAALERYRVVLIDQRGTGRSTPVTAQMLSLAAAEIAEYCTHLRADAIVADCEALRQHLGVARWSVLGQSFGGFTLLHYLSTRPDSVERAYFTGGLPPVGRTCDEVYEMTYRKMAAKSRQFYRMFPGDEQRMRRALELAAAGELNLPNGDPVSASRLRSIGTLLGGDDGAMKLHWLLEHEPTSDAFRYDLAAALPFGGRNPLYAIVHESCYADGGVTAWSAARVRPAEFDGDEPLLSGEHLLPEWFDESSALAPWKDAAELIARVEWPRLYDAGALRRADSVGAAAVYYGDVYVPVEFSMETASLLPGVRTLVTSAYEHSGLRTSAGAVLTHLFELAAGERLR
ncbi:MAG: alpha/beta fold hydrolase [Propionibacteriaceae bacterium]|nr:alpha/beta fold hydrolase [Propionibacteriaceae bacterium]